MHGLPPNIDLSFFHRQRLIQVCVSLHDLQLHFDEGASVTIESDIACIYADGSQRRYDSVTEAAPLVITFLDRVIVAASGTPDGTLQLEFDDHRRMNVFDSTEHYESYLIKYRDKTIAV